MLDDRFVGHAADGSEGGDGAVEGFGGEVAEGEGFVGREAGGSELRGGAIENLLGGGVDGRKRGHGLEAGYQAGVDGGSGFAVELLVNDGFSESFEGRLLRGEAQGERTDAGDETRKFGVGGGERGDRDSRVVGRLAGGA